MNKKNACLANRLMLYINLILLLVGILISYIFISYDFYYEVTVQDEFIGYYKTYEEFENYYSKIKETKNENNIVVDKYLIEEPKFEAILIKPKFAKTFNNSELINKKIVNEYTIFLLRVNKQEKFYIKTKEIAENLINEIKKEVKESTEITIEEFKTKDKSIITNEQDIQEIQQEIIRENYKISSRGGGERVNRANAKYIWPTVARNITSNFGARWGRNHNGIDIGVPLNSKVFAVDDGKVISSKWNGGYGNQIKIQHSNGAITTYAHCNKLLVKAGEQVRQGDVIAYSGSTGNSTGPHLHFEYIVNGNFKNPINYI